MRFHHSSNMSKAGDEVQVESPEMAARAASYSMEGSLRDTTINLMDAVSAGTISALLHPRKRALIASCSWLKTEPSLQLRAQVANQTCFTIGAWVLSEEHWRTANRHLRFRQWHDEQMSISAMAARCALSSSTMEWNRYFRHLVSRPVGIMWSQP